MEVKNGLCDLYTRSLQIPPNSVIFMRHSLQQQAAFHFCLEIALHVNEIAARALQAKLNLGALLLYAVSNRSLAQIDGRAVGKRE